MRNKILIRDSEEFLNYYDFDNHLDVGVILNFIINDEFEAKVSVKLEYISIDCNNRIMLGFTPVVMFTTGNNTNHLLYLYIYLKQIKGICQKVSGESSGYYACDIKELSFNG